MWVGLGNIMSVEKSQDDKVCSTVKPTKRRHLYNQLIRNSSNVSFVYKVAGHVHSKVRKLKPKGDGSKQVSLKYFFVLCVTWISVILSRHTVYYSCRL